MDTSFQHLLPGLVTGAWHVGEPTATLKVPMQTLQLCRPRPPISTVALSSATLFKVTSGAHKAVLTRFDAMLGLELPCDDIEPSHLHIEVGGTTCLAQVRSRMWDLVLVAGP